MVQKKKMKKYKLNARFYVWIISLGIVMCTIFQMVMAFQNNAVPNFHGWSAEKVMEYDAKHDAINVTYELVYSYDVLHNRVLSQSVKPSTKYKDEPITVHIQVSKGYPVMADFIGKSMDELLAFAKAYDIKVIQYASAIVEPQNDSQQLETSEEEELIDLENSAEALSDEIEQSDEDLPLSEGDDTHDESIDEESDDEVTTNQEEEEKEEDDDEQEAIESESVEKQRKIITQSISPGSTILKGSEIEITYGIE
ncbi:MAG TPA: hypothetical protein DCY20_04215 [Firmicutes bacterium]|nr:hypothetical protein [Bacillota bacterium]